METIKDTPSPPELRPQHPLDEMVMENIVDAFLLLDRQCRVVLEMVAAAPTSVLGAAMNRLDFALGDCQ